MKISHLLLFVIVIYVDVSHAGKCARDEEKLRSEERRCGTQCSMKYCGGDADCVCDGPCGEVCVSKGLRCGKLNDPENGSVKMPFEDRFGQFAYYICNKNYELIGHKERLCQSDGTWNGNFEPICSLLKGIHCNTPVFNVENTQIVNSPVKDVYPLESLIQYECQPGSKNKFNTTAHVRCVMKDEKPSWVVTGFLLCEKVTCQPPNNILNGQFEGKDFTFGNKIIYTCDEGFQLRGTNTLTCTDKGEWSHESPVCEDVRPTKGPAITGEKGQKGDKGERGLPGLDKLVDTPGPPGPPGVPGLNGKCSGTGQLLVRHSQNNKVPLCPTGTTKLWDGYSFLFLRAFQKSHSQDLGDAGSCVRKFSTMISMRCTFNKHCYYSYDADLSFWLSSVEAGLTGVTMREEPIDYHISRCAVCDAPANAIAIHSQTREIPDCPPNWLSLWTGYSFLMQISSAPSGSGGQSLVSTGSCLEHWTSLPFIECNGKLGHCKHYAHLHSQWLVALSQGSDYSKPQIQHLQPGNEKSLLSRCRVCIKNV